MAVTPQTANPNPTGTGNGNGKRITAKRITNKQNSDADRLLGCGNGNGSGITAKKTTNQQNSDADRLLGCTAGKEFGKSEPPNSFIKKREEGTKNFVVKIKKSEKKSQTANPNPTGDRNGKSPNSTGDRFPITGRKKFPIEGKGKTAAAKQQPSSSSSEKKSQRANPNLGDRREKSPDSTGDRLAITGKKKFPTVVEGKGKTVAAKQQPSSSSEKKSEKSSPILFITRKKKRVKKKITTNQQTSNLIHLDHLHCCTSDKEFEELELRIEKEMQRTRLTIGMHVNHFFELKSQWHVAKASKLSMRRKSTETKPPNNKKITVDETTEKLSSNIKFRLRKKKPIISRGGLADHGTETSNINSVIRSNSNKRGGGCSQTSTSFQKRRRSLTNFDNDKDPSCSRKKKERKEGGSATAHNKEDTSQERMAKVRKDDAGSTSDNGVKNDTFGWSFVQDH